MNKVWGYDLLRLCKDGRQGLRLKKDQAILFKPIRNCIVSQEFCTKERSDAGANKIDSLHHTTLEAPQSIVFPPNFYRQESMQDAQFIWRRWCHVVFVTYHFLLKSIWVYRLIRNNLKWINLALTLQILDYSTDILEFNTMPMSQLIRLDFSSLEERNVENCQHHIPRPDMAFHLR